MNDPILEELTSKYTLEEDESGATFAEDYFKGKHPNAILTSVDPMAPTEFGRSIKVQVEEDGKKFTFLADAPSADNQYHEVRLNNLKSICHAAGLFVKWDDNGKPAKTFWPTNGLSDFADDATYNELVALLQARVGYPCPINVTYKPYTKKDGSEGLRKNVWGMSEKTSNTAS